MQPLDLSIDLFRGTATRRFDERLIARVSTDRAWVQTGGGLDDLVTAGPTDPHVSALGAALRDADRSGLRYVYASAQRPTWFTHHASTGIRWTDDAGNHSAATLDATPEPVRGILEGVLTLARDSPRQQPHRVADEMRVALLTPPR